MSSKTSSLDAISKQLARIEKRLVKLEKHSHEQPDMHEMLATAVRLVKEVEINPQVKNPKSVRC